MNERLRFAKKTFGGNVNGVPVEVLACYDHVCLFTQFKPGQWREHRNTPGNEDARTLVGYHEHTGGRFQTTMGFLLRALKGDFCGDMKDFVQQSDVKKFAQAFKEARSIAMDFQAGFPRCLTGDERQHISSMYRQAKEEFEKTKKDEEWDRVLFFGRCLHPAEFVQWAKRQKQDEWIRQSIARAEAYLDPGG